MHYCIVYYIVSVIVCIIVYKCLQMLEVNNLPNGNNKVTLKEVDVHASPKSFADALFDEW
jgi:hypothetical protein